MCIIYMPLPSKHFKNQFISNVDLSAIFLGLNGEGTRQDRKLSQQISTQ